MSALGKMSRIRHKYCGHGWPTLATEEECLYTSPSVGTEVEKNLEGEVASVENNDNCFTVDLAAEIVIERRRKEHLRISNYLKKQMPSNMLSSYYRHMSKAQIELDEMRVSSESNSPRNWERQRKLLSRTKAFDELRDSRSKLEKKISFLERKTKRLNLE